MLCTFQVALGTNPLTLMAPGKEDNFELDMATSAVAIGKVINYTFGTYISFAFAVFHSLI